MKNFEERLERLEAISRALKGGQTPLSESIAQFEEGIKIARVLEKELEKMERRVEILIQNGNPDQEKEAPSFELFPDLEDGQG